MKKELPTSSNFWLARPMLITSLWLCAILLSFDAQAFLEIVSKAPASGGTASGGRELQLTINKFAALTLQPNKEIRIYRYSDDALLQTLDLTIHNTSQTGDDLYFTLDEFLPHGVEVYVQIDYGAFINFGANPDEYLPGILDDSWRFTVSSSRPTITDMSIVSNNLAPVDLKLEITFSISVVKSNEDGMRLRVYRKTNDTPVNGFDVIEVDGATATISSSSDDLSNLSSNSEYYVIMDPGYFVQHNSSVRAADGIGQSNQYEWSFTTRVNDLNTPDRVSLSPANGDQRVARLAEDLEFTMTFDEPMYLGNTSGKATLYRAADDFLVRNIGASATLSEDQLSITFTTPNNLTFDTEYYILVDPTADNFGFPFFDADENAIQIISNSTQWRFKTYGSIEKTTFSPTIAATDVSRSLEATLTTDAPLQWGASGDIKLMNYVGSSVAKTISNGSGDVSFNGTSVTIDFGEVDYEKQYYINFDNGAVIDEFDQSVTFSNKQWHFTTEDEPNVAPTDLVLTNSSVNENSAVNKIVGFLDPTDANAGDSHIYSLVSNPGNLFNISGYNLRVNIPLDYETSTSHVIRVEVDDQNGGTFEKDLTITVNNVFEAPTDIALSSESIDENNEQDALIGTLSTTDPDNGETHLYSLLINPGAVFYVTNGNELRTNFTLDFESNESYDIRIQTSDQNGGTFFEDFTININDVVENVAPTDLTLTISSIDENNEDDAAIAGISATDADEGDTHIYTLVSNPDNAFTISSSILYADISFDYETKDSYEITIRAKDQGNNVFEKDFTISINDVMEYSSPTDLTLSDNAFEETRQMGYTIGTFSTTDEDEGETYTYTLAEGDDDDDNDNFIIVGSQLRVNTSFDYESQSTHSIRVQTADGNEGTFQKVFSISVEDDPEVPTDISLDAAAIDENNSVDQVIGVLSTTDPDIGDSHTYTILAIGGSTDHNAFSIDGSNLVAELVFDFETKSSYTIRIRTRDEIGDTYTEDIDITINDVVEPILWNGSAWVGGLVPTATEDVIIDGDFFVQTNGNFGVRNLTVNNGATLTINGDNTLTISGNIINNGSFITESGSSLITSEANTITGNDLIFHRNTRYADGKYSFVGTPVEQNASIVGSDLGSHVYKYDETTPYDADGGSRWIPAATDQLVPGKGYTQANQLGLVFSGMPNMGDIVYNGSYTQDTDDANEGWNLVSNPYTAAINVVDFLDENLNIAGAVYIWDDNGSNSQRGTNADYIVANGSMATSTQNDDDTDRYNLHLGSSQAFFVKLNSDANTAVTFTEDMREIHKNFDDHFFRRSTISIARINLTDEGGLFKQAVVGLSDEASALSLNQKFDAPSFNATSKYGLFTMKAGRTLSLNGMPRDWEEIQLQLNVAEAGTYAISLQLEDVAQMIYLLDQETGEMTDITYSSYSFTAQAGIDTDRFLLVSSPADVLAIAKRKVQIYAADKILHINQVDEQDQDFQLFNMNGKRLLTTKGESEIDLSRFPSGIYLVFDGRRSHKIMLK